jgi:D-alanyl-D-alanine dipeptidase
MKKTIALMLYALLLATACRNDKPAPPNPAPDVSAPARPTRQDTLDAMARLDSTRHDRRDSIVMLEGEIKELKDLVTPAPIKSAPSPAKAAAPAPSKPSLANDASSFAKNGFSDVAALDPSIKLDIRYATADNFTKSKIYDCPRCLLRPEAAKALVKAHKALQKKGYGLKMYDCYRPRPYQQRLWDKVPNPDYVTPPAKGSMHSRGAAVDLTIVDKQGKELNMGTPYDFFGKEAHTDNTNLPAQVLTNRRLLREALEAVGYKGIRTEWWHFSYQGKKYPLSDYVWPCDNKK